MRIVLGVDGSAFSQEAVRTTGKLIVDWPNAEISIISAYGLSEPVAAEPFVAMPEYTQATIDGLAAAAEVLVREAGSEIKKQSMTASVTGRAIMGRAARVILDEAERTNADLIVVGSHGRGFWGRTLLGSVSNAVVHYATCSVLVVRPGTS